MKKVLRSSGRDLGVWFVCLQKTRIVCCRVVGSEDFHHAEISIIFGSVDYVVYLRQTCVKKAPRWDPVVPMVPVVPMAPMAPYP